MILNEPVVASVEVISVVVNVVEVTATALSGKHTNAIIIHSLYSLAINLNCISQQ